MNEYNDYNDLIENPAPRCACMLVLDTSGSMHGQPIDELNHGVTQFIDEVKNDEFASTSVELGIISFGGSVQIINPIQSISQINYPVFQANGDTPMGNAVNSAIMELDKRKQEYKNNGVSYYQPWVVLMTDGAPTDSYQQAAAKLKTMGESKKALVFGIGIGSGCNLNVLSEFCPANRPPLQLAGLQFKQFFQWLSQSMNVVSSSTPGTNIPLPSPSGWTSIIT